MKLNKIVDIGFHSTETEIRLKHFFIFVVVDKSSALIQLNSIRNRPHIAFFLVRDTAWACQRRIRSKSNGQLDRINETKIIKISFKRYMWCVKEIQKGVTLPLYYRLIPDYTEVINAVKEIDTSTIKNRTFVGTPTFQAQNLKLHQNNPIYFEKIDADCATLYAYTSKEKTRISRVVDKIEASKFEKPTENNFDEKTFEPKKLQHFNKTQFKTKYNVSSIEWALKQLECDREGMSAQLTFVSPGLMRSIKTAE